MSEPRKKSGTASPGGALSGGIDAILAGIRVPDLPYPPGKLAEGDVSDWRPLMASCWAEQRDERVTHVIRSVNLDWSVRQVNAAYIADRIMDLFLKTSGLHPELSRRIARLRFYLAWRMNLEGPRAFDPDLVQWLDGLQEWRGWSNTGGRSGKALLDQLQSLIVAVSATFEDEGTAALKRFCEDWTTDARKREAQVEKLSRRLLETEQGASRQRCADQIARALLGRALQNRRLPDPVARFLRDNWYRLLKQAAWSSGVDSEELRHGSKLLEWLVWAGDPALSDKDRNRLYQVGEQLGDRVADVWQRVMSEPLPAGALDGIESVLVARLRGESVDLVDPVSTPAPLTWQSGWLSTTKPEPEELERLADRWFVSGEGQKQERRYFFAFLEDSGEVLWTNGAGVKLGLQGWVEFKKEMDAGMLRPLPELTAFGKVLKDTVSVLADVCEKQRKQRERAAQEARARAEALRLQREAEAEQRRAREAEREAELARQREEIEQKRLADEEAERQRDLRERTLLAEKQVAGIKLGGWITVRAEPERDPQRLKLAVRINASRKLVFVDRLGLNRQEFLESDLVQGILEDRIRILGSSAEFDDTLTRVVGRIRVGRN
jgi:hypothetical protein